MLKVFVVVLLLSLSSVSVAAEKAPEVQIAEQFIELHTGPAVGYPVFYVAEKGEWIEVLKRKTTWFKVRTRKGQEGWVKQQSLALTLNSQAQPVRFFDGSFENFQERDFELGAMGGVLESVSSVSVFGTWVMTENIAAELSFTQALGDFSENQLLFASLTHTTFPEWKISPYIRLGAGQIRTKPRANLVQGGDETRTNDLVGAGIGVRYYLARNFVIKVEYQSLLALTERDENEELEQWKLGFAVFF